MGWFDKKSPQEKMKAELRDDYRNGFLDGTKDGVQGLHTAYYDRGYSDGMTQIVDQNENAFIDDDDEFEEFLSSEGF